MNFCYKISNGKKDSDVNVINETLHHESDYKLFEPNLSNSFPSQIINSSTDDSSLAQQIRDDEICQNYFVSREKYPPRCTISTYNFSTNTSHNTSETTQCNQRFVPQNWVNKPEQMKFDNQKSVSDEQNRSEDSTHIKRPMNAFMVWSQSERKVIASEFPKMHNSDISKILGTRWKALTSDQKKPFIKMAKQLQHKHNIEHPNYKYKPRRKMKRNAKNIQLAHFPVSTAVTNQIEKYLNGFTQNFENHSRHFQNESFPPKPVVFSDSCTFSGQNKPSQFEPSIQKFQQNFEYPSLKMQNYRPCSMGNNGYNTNIESFFPQAIPFTNIDPQNQYSFVPFVPLINQNQFSMMNPHIVALSNVEGLNDQTILQGNIVSVSLNDKQINESDFTNREYLKSDIDLDQSANSLLHSDDGTTYGLSSLTFSGHPLFNHSCLDDPIKNISSCYQLGMMNIQDLNNYCNLNGPSPNEVNN